MVARVIFSVLKVSISSTPRPIAQYSISAYQAVNGWSVSEGVSEARKDTGHPTSQRGNAGWHFSSTVIFNIQIDYGVKLPSSLNNAKSEEVHVKKLLKSLR